MADGFEEIEGLTVVDILRRAGVDTTTVSIMERRNVMGSHKIPVMADACFGEVDFSEGELLVLPGGMPGSKYLAEHKALGVLLKDYVEHGRKVAATVRRRVCLRTWYSEGKESSLLSGGGR